MTFGSELEFIALVRKRAFRYAPGLVRGIGDDCAVLGIAPGQRLCVTTDQLIEGIHFDLRFDAASAVGHKSLAAGLSDIAAMGASPRYALVSIGVPSKRASSFLSSFYRGFFSLADQHHVTLIGGDCSNSKRGVFIDVIVVGSVPAGLEIYRSGARPGDLLFVTGQLGKSALGLSILKSGRKPANPGEREAVTAHRSPAPRCEVGRWLSEHRLATAMIDVSDGLSTDLNHLCDESRVGALLFKEEIPLPAGQRNMPALKRALSGGEDYELLFTVDPSQARKLKSHIGKVPVRPIGAIVRRREGVRWVEKTGQATPLLSTGWDHFR